MDASTDQRAAAPLRLVAGDPAAPDRIEGAITVAIAGEPLALELSVPNGPVAMETLLPVVHGITNAIVARGIAAVEREGKTISCAAGCGACCRQIVPLAESEIRAVAHLVDAMPEPKQSEVRARFEAAMTTMLESDVMDLLNHGNRPAADTIDLILRYFKLGIACPFLEDEACSIHPVRPVICREYLVTSPPENCANLQPGTVARVPMSGNVARALLTAAHGSDETSAWIPLIAALRYVAANPAPEPTLSAPERLAKLFQHL